MEEATFVSSRRELLRLILIPPTLLAGATLVLCTFGQRSISVSAWLVGLLFYLLSVAFFALIYCGRYVEIDVSGDQLVIERPYSLSGQRDILDLTRIRQASMYTWRGRAPSTDLNFYGLQKDTLLLQTTIIPPEAEVATAFAELLQRRGIATAFR